MNKLTIEDCCIVAKNFNGECLSKNYINNHSPLKWKCTNGHIWESIFKDVKRGHWCPYCIG